MKEKIAIIGMGISGAAVLLAYSKELPFFPDVQVDIDCYDSPESFGKGVPFREISNQALNNARSFQISYDYEHELDFALWLEERGIQVPEYASRKLFGDYMVQRSQTLMQAVNATAYPTRIKDLEWLPSLNKWRLTPENSSKGPQATVLYHRVHLCCGELPSGDFYELTGQTRYIHEPYPLHHLPVEIKETDQVAIIGMGLSMVDLVRYLKSEINPAQFLIFSNENHFPAVRAHDERDLQWHFLSIEQAESLIDKQAGNFTVANFTDLLEQEFSRHGLSIAEVKENDFLPGIQGLKTTMESPDRVGLIQRILFQASDMMSVGWEAMDESERTKFQHEYDKLVTTFRNPMPIESAETLIEGAEDGWLKVLEDVQTINPAPNNERLQLITPNKTFEVDWVINATGLDLSMKNLAEDSLLSSLLKRRYALIDTAGGFGLHVATGNIISPRFGEWATLHAHGVLINGAIYQNNSTFKIQRHAHRLIKRLLREAAITHNNSRVDE